MAGKPIYRMIDWGEKRGGKFREGRGRRGGDM